MTTPRRRAAFDPSALNDIDDLLPPLPTPSPADASNVAVPQHKSVVAQSSDGTTKNRESRPAARSRTTAASTSGRVAPPEVYVALRALTLRERATNPVTARTYGRVALDAIEAHADELAQLWNTSHAPETAGSGLFSSPEQTRSSARRRHAQAPARVPLAGVLGSDVEQLDAVAREWGAGSRSALVEAALRRYLRLD
jgi:hypothetical protein